MASAYYDINAQQFSTFNFFIDYRDGNGNPVDLTGYFARLQVRPNYGSSKLYLHIDNDGIATGGSTGEFGVSGGIGGVGGATLNVGRNGFGYTGGILFAVDAVSMGYVRAGSWKYSVDLVKDGRATEILQGQFVVAPKVTQLALPEGISLAVTENIFGNIISFPADLVYTVNGATGNITNVPKTNEENTYTELQVFAAGMSASEASLGTAEVQGAFTAGTGSFIGTVSVGSTLTVNGNLVVNGTETVLNTTTLSVDDKNIMLADTDTPNDAGADGGGITLRGTTDKTLYWKESSDGSERGSAWNTNQSWNLAFAGGKYYVDGAEVLGKSALGAGVTTSSLQSVGTITSGLWSAGISAAGATLSGNIVVGGVGVFGGGISAAGSTFSGLVTSATGFSGPITGAVAGNASSATKLETARAINGTPFDGTSGITTAYWGTARNLTIGQSAKSVDGNTNVSWTLAEIGGVTTSNANTFVPLQSFASGISAAGATLSGTVTAPTRPIGTNDTTLATTAFVQSEIVADAVTSYNGRTGAVQGVSAAVPGDGISVSGTTGAVTFTNTGVTLAVAGTGISVSAGTGRVVITNIGASLGTNTFSGLQVSASGFSGPVTGNASSATKLETARTINGTLFDGTAGITTAYWGTARTVTIGQSAKSVDGNTNVSWTLAEIGGVTTSNANTFVPLQSFAGGISAAGATLSGTVTAPTRPVGTNDTTLATTAFVQAEIVADAVTSYNGRTGAVQGVSAAVAGNGISVSGATGAVTFTNTGVTLAVAGTGISVSAGTGRVVITNIGASLGTNTFTGLQTFNAGISAAGGVTFSGTISGSTAAFSNITVAEGICFGRVGIDSILMRLLEDSNGTLSWEGSEGQLFSVNNNLTTGSIFSVNDASGIPAIEVNVDGTVSIAGFTGNVGIGVTAPTAPLHVGGGVLMDGGVTFGGAISGTTAGFNRLATFSGGISAAGATLSGTVTAPTRPVGTNDTTLATTAFVQSEIIADAVTSYNGRTGAVQGVSAAVPGDGISVSGTTGAVTFTNTGVTLAVAGTGISISSGTGRVQITNIGASLGTNTFTGLQTFNAGISASGGITLNGLVNATTRPIGTNDTTLATTAFVQNEIVADAVTSVNGATGAITDVARTVLGNTFTPLQTFSGGISAAGATLGNLRVTGGITAEGAVFGGNVLVGATLTVSGNLVVNGTETVLNTTTLTVDDKNIVLGDTPSPTDTSADGGGITLRGTTDKTLYWKETSSGGDVGAAWNANQNLNLSGAALKYYIDGAEVLGKSALGAGVTSSSLQSVGTISGGLWSAGISAAGATLSALSVSGLGVFGGGISAAGGITLGGTVNAVNGISAAGGITFNGSLSGTTAAFSRLVQFAQGISAAGATLSANLQFTGSSGIVGGYVDAGWY
jgi:hypothetical protein